MTIADHADGEVGHPRAIGDTGPPETPKGLFDELTELFD